jgi:hypothetical protein
MSHDIAESTSAQGSGAGRHLLRPFVVLAFGSTREALAAEEALLDAGLTVRPVPLPRHRGSLCGIALRLPPEQEATAHSQLAERGIFVAARDEIEDS